MMLTMTMMMMMLLLLLLLLLLLRLVLAATPECLVVGHDRFWGRMTENR